MVPERAGEHCECTDVRRDEREDVFKEVGAQQGREGISLCGAT